VNIYQKLIEVRKVVPYLQKESEGHQYKYVGSSQVLAAVRLKMDELGLLLIPKIITPILHEKTANNAKENLTELVMEFTWVNAEKPDEQIVIPWYGQGLDTGEKGVGKALTYAEKYFLLKQFNIATDKDDPDAFQAKMEEQARPPVPVKLIGEIKTEWTKKGYQLKSLDAQSEKLYGVKLTGLTEEQARDFLDKLTGKKEAV
jgi:hypothetical protein